MTTDEHNDDTQQNDWRSALVEAILTRDDTVVVAAKIAQSQYQGADYEVAWETLTRIGFEIDDEKGFPAPVNAAEMKWGIGRDGVPFYDTRAFPKDERLTIAMPVACARLIAAVIEQSPAPMSVKYRMARQRILKLGKLDPKKDAPKPPVRPAVEDPPKE